WVGSRPGRTDGAHGGGFEPQPGTLAPARDREMRQPRPTLAAVDAESFQPLLDVVREQCRPALLVLEHEHADAPRLPVAHRSEVDLPRSRSDVAQRADDRFELAGRPVAEEGEGDVQELTPDGAHAAEVLALPALDR